MKPFRLSGGLSTLRLSSDYRATIERLSSDYDTQTRTLAQKRTGSGYFNISVTESENDRKIGRKRLGKRAIFGNGYISRVLCGLKYGFSEPRQTRPEPPQSVPAYAVDTL